jgi:radical SAM superfamily enzyme YgiQ (UPF0313 family)
MLNHRLREFVIGRILPRILTPAQYIGGELNIVRKDHRHVRGKLCMAFPDTYTIGMSHHGLQVLYSLINGDPDWVCERAFTPGLDFEAALRRHNLPLYGLESFTPLCQFDVLGFTLQYEICTSNLLTMLDLGRIPLRSADRTMADPLVIAGGPCAQNPEPLAPFIDVFVTGDGEPSLPAICDTWLKMREECRLPGREPNREACREAGPLGDLNPPRHAYADGAAGRSQRENRLAALAARLPFAYAPRFYEPEYRAPNENGRPGRFVTLNRTRADVPETIEPSVIADLDAIPIPTKPIVPFVECVHDRIAIEIMRGCPWQCRFCQSTVIKRPLRIRSVETIVQGALETYRATGHNEISILSLSSSDYPHFVELVGRLHEVFTPLGVTIAVPSLRVNEMIKTVARLIPATSRSGLTLAPEVARDDMREQIRKKISNNDLYEGSRVAFEQGFKRVKLYFLIGLPGERQVDLDGIIDMAENIARIGREVRGRNAEVVASVSNFVPKAHTPYQWNAMQTREYFDWAHRYMRKRLRLRSVALKCHDTNTSLLEGVLSRGDRRLADAVELAWRRGARLESWTEHMDHKLWKEALRDAGIDAAATLHDPYELSDRLPWDHTTDPCCN